MWFLKKKIERPEWQRQAMKEVFEKLEAEGKIRDSGGRTRDGLIIWIGVSEEEFTGKPWPRFVRDDNRVV